MMRFLPALAAAAMVLSAGRATGQTAILWNPDPPRPGTALREETRLALEKGSFVLDIKDQSLHGGAHATAREIIERRYVTPLEQRIDVLDSARNIRFSFGGGGSGEPKDTVGHLLGKKLTGRKNGSRWTYSLAGGRSPDAAEASALKQFSAYCAAVEALGLLYGTQPRRVGDVWKPDIGTLRNSNPDITASLECRLEEIRPEQGDTIARVAVTGKLTANIGNGGAVQVDINGLIRRSLRDMIDLETDLQGTFRYTGRFGKAGGDAEIHAPIKVRRTVTHVKRTDGR